MPVLNDRFLKKRIGGRIADRHAAMGGGLEKLRHAFEEAVRRQHPARVGQHRSRQADRLQRRHRGLRPLQPKPCRDQTGAREMWIEQVKPLNVLDGEITVARPFLENESDEFAARHRDDCFDLALKAEVPKILVWLVAIQEGR